MAVDPSNRALGHLLSLLEEDRNDALVWRNEDGGPSLVVLIDWSDEPAHTVTLAVTSTEEGGACDRGEHRSSL